MGGWRTGFNLNPAPLEARNARIALARTPAHPRSIAGFRFNRTARAGRLFVHGAKHRVRRLALGHKAPIPADVVSSGAA
jgi:hypothetical protein